MSLFLKSSMAALAILILRSGVVQESVAAETITNCNQTQPIITDLVHKYQGFVANSKSDDADRAYESLHDFLYTQLGEEHPCFKNAAAEMIETSLYVPTTKYVRKIDEQLGGGGGLNFGGNFVENPVVSELFVDIYNADHIVLLTQKLRKKMGGRWLERSDDGYLAVSSYDCAESKIYIDPEQRPMDIAVTLTHELDHLARDKFYQSDMTQFAGSDGKVDWNAYNLADEAAAVSYSASLVLQLQSYYKHYFKHDNYFDVKNDFTFFRKKGLLHQLDVPSNIDFDGKQRASFIFSMGSESTAVSQMGINAGKRKALRNEFFATIWDAYFPGLPVPSSFHGDFDSFFTFSWNGFGNWMDENISAPFSNALHQGGFVNTGTLVQNSANTLLSALNAPSNSCKAYIESLEQGGVDHYLGTHFEEDGTGRSTNRPCLQFKKKF